MVKFVPAFAYLLCLALSGWCFIEFAYLLGISVLSTFLHSNMQLSNGQLDILLASLYSGTHLYDASVMSNIRREMYESYSITKLR